MKKPPPPKVKKSGTIALRVDPDVKTAAMWAAEAADQSLSNWVSHLIAAAVRDGKKGTGR